MEEMLCIISSTRTNVTVFVPYLIKGLAICYPTGTDTVALYITKFTG